MILENDATIVAGNVVTADMTSNSCSFKKSIQV